MSATSDYPRLIDSLNELRRRWRQKQVLTGSLLALAVVSAVFLGAVVVDNLLKPEVAGRVVLAGTLWGTLILAVLGLVIRRWLEDHRDDYFAALVERKHPELHNGLINALQLGRGNQDGVSRQLIDAIVADAARSTADLEMADSLDVRPTRRAVRIAEGIAALLMIYALAFAPRFANGAARVLLPLAEIPPYTASRVIDALVKPGDTRIPEGVAVRVEARVAGLIPSTATLLRRTGEGPWHASPLVPDRPAPGQFRGALPPADESFQYQIVAGDGRSRPFRVEVVRRPRVANIAVTLAPPSYTALPRKQVATSLGELSGLAGTTVVLELSATKPLRRAAFITETRETIELTKGRDDRSWQTSFVIGSRDSRTTIPTDRHRLPCPARYQIQLQDTDGFESTDPLWRSIAVVRDQAPTVAISTPGRDIQAKPDAVIPLAIDSKDDYGLGAVGIVYRVNDEESVRELTAFAHEGPPKLHASDRFEWNLARSGMKPGDRIQYWATAADRNDVSGPGRAESRRFSLFLTTPEEAVAKLDYQIQDYAQILEALLRLQRENRAQTASGAAFEGLVTRQALIRSKTGLLARAMEKDALPVATFVRALDELVAGLMAESVLLLETGRDASNPVKAADARDQSLPVQDQIIAQLEALLARLQRNEQAKEALRKLSRQDKPAHLATTKVLGQMVKDLDRLLTDQAELAAKFEKLPKKPVEEFKDEAVQTSKELDDLKKAWEAWAKGTVAELTKLPQGFVDDFQMRPDVNKVFEEIEKAASRPKATPVEVALEDLGAGLGTKMKEDLELWMPDTPDAAKWVLEEPLNKKPFQVPEMPLPDALEDLIGDLLQEADEFDEEADDITSAWGDNLDQAGWGVSDGPISTFSAKGKTGNDLPNNMEVSGRAGDGRRGKSSGQMVGDTSRALAGRKTPARVGAERYEPGQLKQQGSQDPNGATGGGKKAGAGRRGLQGGTPPDFARDMGRLGEKQAALREKAEQVAQQLDTAGMRHRRLDESIELMKTVEQDLRDLRYEDAARQRRVALGRLHAAFTDLDATTAAQLSRARVLPPQLRSELIQAADEGYPPGYETLLKSYFKALSSAEQ